MMRSICFIPLLILVLLSTRATSPGFSLLGPFEPWQVPRIGYNTYGSDPGGPMNLGEEYRWNAKVITYGVDESFLNYFGSPGEKAIDSAVAVFNALPTTSKMSDGLEEFPLDTVRENYEASALGLLDLKSMAMSLLIEQLGLANPERFVWTLRDRRITGTPPVTNYIVIQRNFDPVRLLPSAFVNGALFTYFINNTETPPPPVADAYEALVDPFNGSYAVASSSESGGTTRLNFGQFFTGLTRDDVGGLRYLYTPLNRNVEELIPGTTGGSASPYGSPTDPADTNTLVNAALRPGIGKLKFTKLKFDSRTGYFNPYTNSYTDTYITNRQTLVQGVQRVQTRPDIIFSAADLLLTNQGEVVSTRSSTTATWDNNNNINGVSGEALAGPGVIQPVIEITFSKLGPFKENSQPNFVQESDATDGFRWGSFDGTTNAPVIYPQPFFQY